MSDCDICGKEAELFYDEDTGLALCDACLFRRAMQQGENVKLISITPDAEALILYCARVSSDQSRTDTGLLNYLIRNGHWSPFEMAHAVLEFQTSRAIGREILRHRSFSFQEFSQRYATLGQADWVETVARVRGATNRQSSLVTKDLKLITWWQDIQLEINERCHDAYEEALNSGIAPELARMLLPEATRTKIYAAGTLRSWIHYFEQRCTGNTQKEHYDLACEARAILKHELPIIGEACGW